MTGDDTLLELFREGREKGEQGSESQSWRRRKIKESMFLITRVSVLTAHTGLEIVRRLTLTWQVEMSTCVKHGLETSEISF